MSNLDTMIRRCNTPEAREALINAPAAMIDMTLATYAEMRPIPEALTTWLQEFETNPKSMVLFGKPGLGKTGLGVGALKELARRGVGSRFEWNLDTDPVGLEKIRLGLEEQDPSPVWFERWQRLLARERRQKLDEDDWFDKLDECVTVLMIDDIGMEQGTTFREGFLMRHLEWAEDKRGRALILTFNTDPSRWTDTLGERITDRITERRRFTQVKVEGTTLR